MGRLAALAAVAAAVVATSAAARPPHPSIPTVEAPWAGAGAFVWHEDAVDPVVFAQRLRREGFSWAAVFLHEGVDVDPVEPGWIERYRAAGGPPLGGWGVLRTSPRQEAGIAVALPRAVVPPVHRLRPRGGLVVLPGRPAGPRLEGVGRSRLRVPPTGVREPARDADGAA